MFTRFTAISTLVPTALVSAALLATGCDSSDGIGLAAASVDSTVLAELATSDDQPVSDFSKAVLDAYGIKLDVVNFVIPSFTVQIMSSLADLHNLQGQTVVSGWATEAVDVINNAYAFKVSFNITGIESSYEDGKACENAVKNMPALATFVANQVKGGLEKELKMNVVGTDPATNNKKVLSISPSAVDYSCIVDNTLVGDSNDDYCNALSVGPAITCAGKVRFTLN